MPDPLKESKELRFKMGEIYDHILTVDAFHRGVSSAQQANSLLGARLIEREPMVAKRNAYLAWIRGKTPAQMWLDTITGVAEPISTDEIIKLREQGLIDETGDVPGLRDSK